MFRGNNEQTNISNSMNMGNIKIEVDSNSNSVTSWIGGIIGYARNANVNNTNNNGNITLSEGLVDNGSWKGVGGIIGHIESDVTITESTSSGIITAPTTITWGEQVGDQKP